MKDDIPLGELRWPVTIAMRAQRPADDGTGLVEELVGVRVVHARIKPVGKMTFYAGAQIDTPVTHEIAIRWIEGVDTTWIIQRELQDPNGDIRNDLFRIRRIAELEGRRRFLIMDCEQETRS